MKKMTLLLFMAGLFVIGFYSTNCSRRSSDDVAPIAGGDTIKTKTTIDSSGEHLHVSVYQNNTTSGSSLVSGGHCEVYLFNNFKDYEAYATNQTLTSSYIDSANADGTSSGTTQGECTFFVKAKYATGGDFPKTTTPYTYYMAAVWHTPGGQTWQGWYNSKGDYTTPENITVSINDGLNNAGLSLPFAVLP